MEGSLAAHLGNIINRIQRIVNELLLAHVGEIIIMLLKAIIMIFPLFG
jgi:hypothetical protein